jgi:hypothetical protein
MRSGEGRSPILLEAEMNNHRAPAFAGAQATEVACG